MNSLDDGWKSRKLWFSVFSSLLLLAGAIIGGYHPGIAGIYAEYVGGVVAINMALVGGNVAARWVQAKHAQKTPAVSPAEPPAQ